MEQRAKSFFETLERASASTWVVVGLTVTLLLGLLDYLTGNQLTFSFFYLIPIVLVTWAANRNGGLLISFLSALILLAAEIAAGQTYSHPILYFLNTLVRTLFFVVIVYLLSELIALRKEEHLANIRLTELDRRKNEFLSIVSHELRTPLTPIQSCIQNLLAEDYGPLTEKQRSRLEIALTNAREEVRLINNLLDLARIEDGKEQLKLQKGNLAKTIQDVVTIFKYDAESKEIEIINLVTSSDQLEIVMDITKIRQVLVNLISNALKFTLPKGKIAVSHIIHTNRVEILVRDTGIGIPLEEQEKIFDRFYQVNTSLKRKVGGTGIGLSIAKSYVELHNGIIWAESTPGFGSTFHFTIPILNG